MIYLYWYLVVVAKFNKRWFYILLRENLMAHELKTYLSTYYWEQYPIFVETCLYVIIYKFRWDRLNRRRRPYAQSQRGKRKAPMPHIPSYAGGWGADRVLNHKEERRRRGVGGVLLLSASQWSMKSTPHPRDGWGGLLLVISCMLEYALYSSSPPCNWVCRVLLVLYLASRLPPPSQGRGNGG